MGVQVQSSPTKRAVIGNGKDSLKIHPCLFKAWMATRREDLLSSACCQGERLKDIGEAQENRDHIAKGILNSN